MLYNYKNEIHFMLGAEKLPEVKDFNKLYSGKNKQEILKYIFFAYKKQGTFALLPPAERKELVIEKFELFKDFDNWDKPDFWAEIENMQGVIPLIRCYQYHTYSYHERNLLIYLMKAEKYQGQLTTPGSTLDDEIEANKGLEMWTRKIKETEDLILSEIEQEEDSVTVMHLFEVPDKHKSDHAIF